VKSLLTLLVRCGQAQIPVVESLNARDMTSESVTDSWQLGPVDRKYSHRDGLPSLEWDRLIPDRPPIMRQAINQHI